MKDFQNKVKKGLFWNGGSSVALQVFNILVGIVLARLLTPTDFGYMTMVFVFTGFANIFMDLGFSAAIVQNQKISTKHFSSVFWMNLGLGLLLSLVLFLSGNFIANFYEEPILVKIIPIISLVFILKSLGMVQRALLQKELKFKTISIIRICSHVISGVAAILFAFFDYGFWSLVYKILILDFCFTLFLWIASEWKPLFSVRFTHIKELASFSLNVTGVYTFEYWTRKIDDILIGKFLGSDSLGVYNRAYGFLLLPLNNIKTIVTGVMFPAMSKIQNDKERIKRLTLKTKQSLAFISFPLMLCIFLISEDFVLVILGDHWIEMIPIMKIFCLAAIPDSIRITGIILKSIDRTDLLLKIALITKSFFVGCVIFGLQYGLKGVAIAVAVGLALNFIVMLYIAGKQIDLSLTELFQKLFSIVANNILTLGCAWIISAYLWDSEVSLYSLVGKVILFGLIFLVIDFVNTPKIRPELVKLIRKR